MTNLSQSVVSLKRPLIAKRARSLANREDITIGLEERFIVIGEHRGKLDLRFMGRGPAGLSVDFGLINVPKNLVMVVEPLVRYMKICPNCQKKRPFKMFRQGRANCSVCVSKSMLSKPKPRKTKN
jgi:hypothetical protein